MEHEDVVVVGAGIIGLATARAILQMRPTAKVVVLEKEKRPAQHQTGRNSGVIHSGIYYRPGSVKARTVAAGRAALVNLCRDNGVAHQIMGKVVVAVNDAERDGLRELQRRAAGNGVPVSLIDRHRLAELEPHAVGVEALHVPSAGIVDFQEVCEVLLRLVETAGGELRPAQHVTGFREGHAAAVVETTGEELSARVAINCTGLHSDTIARRSSPRSPAGLRIVPFRGEYRRLTEARSHLVRTMIYPVPDPRFPFLGVHFTRAVGGEVHAGPNAVLALAREGYSWRDIDLRDSWDLLRFGGFRRLVARHWRTGLDEMKRSLSQRSFLSALQRLVPEVQAEDLLPAEAGVRAQAVDENGALVDDFVVQGSRRCIHVLNAPSPAATASIEIGRMVAEQAVERL